LFGGFAQKRLELGEELLDRIEIGRIGRQVEEGGAQAALDVGAEDLAAHRAVDDEGRSDRIGTQPRHQGRGLPMTVRHAPDQPRTAPAAAAPTGHVGGGAGLVDEDQLFWVKLPLSLGFPQLPGARHVRAFLLRGVHGFF
jgi:hypothetical protein